jgi:hypothetical protein
MVRKTKSAGSKVKITTANLAAAKATSSIKVAKALGKPVPHVQWDMPAGFRPDGQIATLKEVVDPKVPTLSLGEISPEQRADLVVKRIEQQPDFKITMFPAGVIDKDRAIAEVKAQSKVGKTLTEIEQRVINNLVERATGGPSSEHS